MDLYALLGLAQTASDEEISRAYRRLARRYHPGVNPGDRVAEQMYRQIQEAYGVLADAERRREYDRGLRVPAPQSEAAVAFEGFDFSAPAEGPLAATFSELFADVFQRAARDAVAPGRGSDIEVPLTVDLSAAVRGADVPMSITRQDRCPSCQGSGQVARRETLCQTCQGAGSRRWARGHMVFTRECDGCGGSGRQGSDPCRTCRGGGVAVRTEVVTIRLPAGIESGARVAVPGRGHAGAHGAPAGDLYVTVTVAEHPHFRRQGRDLFLTLPVALHEAALGAVIDVPTLDGPVRLRIPPGSSSGRRLRVRDHGVGAGNAAGQRSSEGGDLIVELQIVVPRELDEPSRELLREFGRRHPDDVRRELFEQP
jgi:molecular chaperone DnaJ